MVMLPRMWLMAAAVPVAIVAVLWGMQSRTENDDHNHVGSSTTTPTAQKTTTTSRAAREETATTSSAATGGEEYSVYVIGDLHGDAECARQWVERTGLVRRRTASDDDDEEQEQQDAASSSLYEWTDPTSTLIFMGDYVDKGVTSKQTLELVQHLTEAFPDHVVALMGNHELELLRDRDVRTKALWGGYSYHQLSFSSVHPGEYLNYLDRPLDDTDHRVVDALYNASVEVYAGASQRRQLQSTFLTPHTGADLATGAASIVDHVQPPEFRPVVQARLAEYQQRYMATFAADQPLGAWLEHRPVIHRINNTVFCHGGVPPEGKSFFQQLGKQSLPYLNEVWYNHSAADKIDSFLKTTYEGNLVYYLLTYRGNHKAGSTACTNMRSFLPRGLSRIVVGHTPDDSVRIKCDGNLVAVDSSLSRYFRESGNMYCPGTREIVSRNKRYHCKLMQNHCEGQIVRLSEGGRVDILTMT